MLSSTYSTVIYIIGTEHSVSASNHCNSHVHGYGKKAFILKYLIHFKNNLINIGCATLYHLSMTYITVNNLSINYNYRILAAELKYRFTTMSASKCFIFQTFYELGVNESYNILSTSFDKLETEYISTIEHKHFPIFGTQWHPEKAPFEWKRSTIPHTADAVSIHHHVMEVFMEHGEKLIACCAYCQHRYRSAVQGGWRKRDRGRGNCKCNCKWGLIGVLSNCQGPIKDTKRTRGRLDRNGAPCSRPITTVIGPLHECKKVCPCTKALPPSGSRAWIKQGRKKRKKRGRETGKTEARRLMERKAAQQNKNTLEELKQGLPT